MEHAQLVVIDYTNYRGERSSRTILPNRIWHGSTEFHPTPQWLLDAHDVAKDAMRTFAMEEIHSWHPSTGAPEEGGERVSA